MKRIYQAGLTCGQNSWAVCGFGKSIEEARIALEKAKHIDALKFISDFSRKYPENAFDGKFLEKMYQDHLALLNGHRYIETSFIDQGDPI